MWSDLACSFITWTHILLFGYEWSCLSWTIIYIYIYIYMLDQVACWLISSTRGWIDYLHSRVPRLRKRWRAQLPMGQTLIGSGTQTKHISPGIGSREHLQGLHGKNHAFLWIFMFYLHVETMHGCFDLNIKFMFAIHVNVPNDYHTGSWINQLNHEGFPVWSLTAYLQGMTSHFNTSFP